MRIIPVLLFFVISIGGSSQEIFHPDLSGFSQETIVKAKSNDMVMFMTDEEKEVVFYSNLVRLKPHIFLETIVKPYVKINYPYRNYYVKSLVADLKRAQPVGQLVMKKDLYIMSRNHQADIGKNSIHGHTGSKGKTFNKRAKHLMLKYYGVSENIGLGFISPIENVLELLIDDGVVDLGHRVTILSEKYNCVGVSIGTHKTYGTGCVIDYGFLLND